MYQTISYNRADHSITVFDDQFVEVVDASKLETCFYLQLEIVFVHTIITVYQAKKLPVIPNLAYFFSGLKNRRQIDIISFIFHNLPEYKEYEDKVRQYLLFM